MSLNERALLVNLVIHQWTNQKTDKKAKDAVTEKFALDTNQDRYVKRLIDPRALTTVSMLAGHLRAVHSRYTLPWQDNGVRILPSISFMKYTEDVTHYRNAFEGETQKFIAQYAGLKEAAKSAHKELYNEADYPTEVQLQAAFGVEVNYLPFPDAGDFRVDIDPKIKADAQASYAKATKDAMDTFMGGLVERLDKLFNVILSVRESSLDALRGQVELLPSMNLLQDPKVTEAHDVLVTALRGASANEMRRDAVARAMLFRGIDAASKLLKERA